MTIGQVFASRLVQIRGVAHELETGHVAAWVRVCQVCRRLVDARARSSWTKTRNLQKCTTYMYQITAAIIEEWSLSRASLLTLVENEFDIMSFTVPTTLTFSWAYVPGPLKAERLATQFRKC